jgi:hypothetical protein
MHNAPGNMAHLVWGNDDDELSSLSQDGLEADADWAALEEAWLSLRTYFEDMRDLEAA